MNTPNYNRGFSDGQSSLTPTLDKALEALEMCKRKTVERIEIAYFRSTEELEEELAKITEAINEIKKLKG